MMMLGLFAALLATPVEFRPAGAWELAEEDTGCQVQRGYTGDAEVTLGLENNFTSTRTTILLAAPRAMLPASGPGEMPVTVSGRTIQVHYGVFDTADPKVRLVKLLPDDAALDAITSAETIEIGATPIRLPVKGIGGALKGLRSCNEGLLTGWGADPQLWRDGKLASFGNQPQSWLTDDDADDLLPRGVAHGKITALIMTKPDGAPSSCKAIATTDPRIDKPFCDLLMRRTRYRAPLGADGKPIASYVIVPLRLDR